MMDDFTSTSSIDDEFYDYPCTNPIAATLDSMWSNYSASAFSSATPIYLAYVCRFADYWSSKDTCASIEGYSSLILGAFGLLGSLANVLTLWQRRFRAQSDFTLFRAVGYLEIVQMSFIVTITSLAYFHCETSYACAFIWAHIATTVNNVCADGVDIIVFFLSVERTIACLLPHLFHKIHNLRFVIVVIAISICLPAFFAICQALEVVIVYSDEDFRFIDIPSAFSQSTFYAWIVQINSIRLYSSVVLITLATISSVIGFRTVSVRQRRLLSINKENSSGNFMGGHGSNSRMMMMTTDGEDVQHQLVEKKLSNKRQSIESTTASPNPRAFSFTSHATVSKKRQTDLCCLQLCLAAPVVVNLLLYTMGLSTSYSFLTGKVVFEKNLTYTEAMGEIEKAESFLLLRTATNVSNVLAHALHFYLYLLFSANVRKGFIELAMSLVRLCTISLSYLKRVRLSRVL